MARTRGLLNFSGNFEVNSATPFDARVVIPTKAELLLDTSWQNDGTSYAYKGMVVAVYDDDGNNGIYVLIDNDYTDEGNWLLVGGGSASFAGLEEWESWKMYCSGDNTFVVWNQNIWKFAYEVDETHPPDCFSGVEPGTNPDVWELSSIGALTHSQNTDYKIQTYSFTIDDSNISTYYDAATNTLDLMSIHDYNLYLFTQTTGIEIDYIIRLSSKHQMMFYFSQDGNIINNTTGSNGITTLSGDSIGMDDEDWIVINEGTTDNMELYSSKGSGGGLILITDATVISNITDNANWSNGVYSGATTGLVEWNYYTDGNYEYTYDGTTLTRSDVKLAVTEQMEITGDNTGFRYPSTITVTDNGDDTVTINDGTDPVEAYYHGLHVTTLVDGYTSSAVTALDTSKVWFLTYNGTDIDWRDISIYTDFFKDVLISVAFYDTANSAWVFLQETHGMVMDKDTHGELHRNIGTYLISGGDITGVVLDSTTASERRPNTSQAVVRDEDKNTTIPAHLSTDLYTQGYNTGTGTFNFDIDNDDIIPLSTNQPYWNSFSSPNWGQTLFTENQFGTVWEYLVPVALGASQKYRTVFVQPQWVTDTAASGGSLADRLAAAQATEEARTQAGLNITSLEGLTPESIAIKRYTIKYDGTTWSIVNVITLGGTRVSQTQSPSGNFLSSVSSDNTLTGDGTTGSPLSQTGQTLEMKLTQAPVYYSDSTIKQVKYEYLKDSTLYYEQRFEYTSGKVTKEEVKDDANGTWLQITYTYTGDEMDLPTYTTISAWTITI